LARITATEGRQLKISPDGRYVLFVTTQGRLDLNTPQETIWLFSSAEVKAFARNPATMPAPSPQPLVRMATFRDGPIITGTRWLPDSSGVAFLAVQQSLQCKYRRLFIADIKTGSVKALTPEDEDVVKFDAADENHYVYEVQAPELLSPRMKEFTPPVALTGARIGELFWPSIFQLTPFDRSGLWAVLDGKPFLVMDSETHKPIETFRISDLNLAPHARSVIAIAAVNSPPEFWARYKAPPGYKEFKSDQDRQAYYLIDLQSGMKRLLVNAPTGLKNDWNSHFFTARWSSDGQSVLLSNTFFPLDVPDPKEIADRESHPYIAVLQLGTGQLSRVLAVKAGLDKARYAVTDMYFADDRTIVVTFDRSYAYTRSKNEPAAIFHRESDGSWRQTAGDQDPRLAALQLVLRESMNLPQVLAVENRVTHALHVMWDPNPQIKDIRLGMAEVIRWKDETGYAWEAGLLHPPNYVSGKRYPLVIQTHGFNENIFLSNGSFSTAFAAQSLAAEGMVVVQMSWNPQDFATEKEGPKQIAGFESLVKKLTDEGVVDPARVGAIGFSRSVYHVMEQLTLGRMPFAAASVTDGVTFDYFSYVLSFAFGPMGSPEAEAVNGGKPFVREGLRNWIEKSPGFNLEQVKTPLLLLHPGKTSVIYSMEPYAALQALHKPVDLIMLPEGTHVMSNPAQRLAAETINVDWFRYWLKGEEDPAPRKAEQYARWRELRRLHEADLKVGQEKQ